MVFRLGFILLHKCNTFLSKSIPSLFLLSILISFLLLRKQLFIDDNQWLKRMISHHSTALTTSHTIFNKTNNPKIKKLAKEIIITQEKEIKIMKQMLI